MELKLMHYIGIGLSLVMLIVSLFFIGTAYLAMFIGIAVIFASAPFVLEVMHNNKVSLEKEEMFLEFARNLVESVKTGTPVSKSIINAKDKPYGVLSVHVKKLANQIHMGIPLGTALQIFAKDVHNPTVTRAITLIGEAEKAGGDIGEILEAVAGAVNMSDKLRKERKASISTLVVQGYIIFIVFIAIILVMQFKILPMISGIADLGQIGGIVGAGGGGIDSAEIGSSFLYLLLIQGLFSGLTIGQLSEGNVKSGIKHSFALMLMAFIVSTLANVIFGGAVAAT